VVLGYLMSMLKIEQGLIRKEWLSLMISTLESVTIFCVPGQADVKGNELDILAGRANVRTSLAMDRSEIS
jgi:hypothetical protein